MKMTKKRDPEDFSCQRPSSGRPRSLPLPRLVLQIGVKVSKHFHHPQEFHTKNLSSCLVTFVAREATSNALVTNYETRYPAVFLPTLRRRHYRERSNTEAQISSSLRPMTCEVTGERGSHGTCGGSCVGWRTNSFGCLGSNGFSLSTRKRLEQRDWNKEFGHLGSRGAVGISQNWSGLTSSCRTDREGEVSAGKRQERPLCWKDSIRVGGPCSVRSEWYLTPAPHESRCPMAPSQHFRLGAWHAYQMEDEKRIQWFDQGYAFFESCHSNLHRATCQSGALNF